MSLFRKLTETVSKGVSTATEKAQQTVEITRLHSQISGKRKEIEKMFTDIGEAVFDGYLAKDLSLAESKVIPACEEIVAIRSEIDALDDRIMQLRNEKECECGKKVPYDTRFCPACGHRFPEPAVPAAEAAEPEENKVPYEDDFPSADPFAEPAGDGNHAEPASAADWSDVGMPPRGSRYSATGWADPEQGAEADPDPSGTEQHRQTEKAVCPACEAPVDPNARFCPSCGTALR